VSEPDDTSTDQSSPDEAGGRRGSIRRQDSSTAQPRKPTVAEARQRDKNRKAREAAEEFAREQERQAEQRSASRRKVLMGTVAVVGLVGAVALGYQLLNTDDEVSATCVRDGSNEVVSDQYCSTGSGGVGGVFIYAGSPYRYYYGGSNGGVGSTARGGTLELPRGTVGKTSSGKTTSGGSVSRGGFGSGSAGSSSGS
jgi:hypothetical protein